MDGTALRRPGSRLSALLVLTVVGLLFLPGSPASARTDDAATVYCLGTPERPRLVEAAIALKLGAAGSKPDRIAAGGQDLTLDDWRLADPDGFDRSCAALWAGRSNAAPRSSASTLGLLAVLGVALPFTGALISVWAASWRDGVARRRTQAEALRSAAERFLAACRAWLREWEGPGTGLPSSRAVDDSRSELIAQLDRLAAVRPRWSRITTLRASLRDPVLGDPLSQGWADTEDTAREARGKLVEVRLVDLQTTVNRIADALGRPVRSRRAPRA